MLVLTTPEVQGKKIVKYLGIVSGESIIGADFIREFISALKHLRGGRSEEYEEELERAKKTALEEMITEAEKLGANSIIGARMDYEALSSETYSMLMVCVSGTAVILEEDQ